MTESTCALRVPPHRQSTAVTAITLYAGRNRLQPCCSCVATKVEPRCNRLQPAATWQRTNSSRLVFYAIAPPQAVQFLPDAVVLRLHKKEATFDKQTSLHEVHAHFYAMFSQANAALGTHSAAIPMCGTSVYRGTCATWHVCNMARVIRSMQHGTRATWHVSYAACNMARVQHGTCHAACNMARHRCVGLRAVALSRLRRRDQRMPQSCLDQR